MIIPTAIGAAAFSILARFIGPPLLVALAPPPSQQPVPGIIRCEGYYPDPEVCIPLGSHRPLWFKVNRDNMDCPQWRIDPTWEKSIFTHRLAQIEGVAKEWESMLEVMDADTMQKCGGEEVLKPTVWLRRERGVAWSRINSGVIAGNSEYHCDRPEKSVCWTDALLPIYVDEFSVKPSDDISLVLS